MVDDKWLVYAELKLKDTWLFAAATTRGLACAVTVL